MTPTLEFTLHERQSEAFRSTATELLYGGAAGGGKSHLSRVLAIHWAVEIAGCQIFIFRRLYNDLILNHLEGPTGFRAILAPLCNSRHPQSPLIANRLCEIVDGEIRFWNGSKIFLCHLQHQKDVSKYYGVEIHALFLEEATQFTEYMIRFLRSRLRIPTALKIPEKFKNLFPRAVYTSNPGGVGHAYIKRAFMGRWRPYEIHQADADDGGYFRQYIPARVDDNPSLDRDKVKLGLGGLPPQLVDALLNGNWDAVIGAYFPELNPEAHLIQPFAIPAHWLRFMALDWGACGDGDPFAIGWFAVSDGSLPQYPRDALVMYRSYYGRGLPKVTVQQVIEGIRQREREEISYRVAGGDILEKRGTGPSIFELFHLAGIHFQRADQRRVSGWQQLRERLVGRNGIPRLYFFEQCAAEIETISNLQCDPNNPNDCAAGDDHVADMVRYACMSRPWVVNAPAGEITPQQRQAELERAFKPPTYDDVLKLMDRNKSQQRRSLL